MTEVVAQVAMIAADSKALFEEEARERQRGGQGGALLSANLREASGKAADQAAVLCGISPRSVESASKVKARGAPGLVDAVRKGEVAVSAAAKVVELPEEEQEQLVAAGPKAE